MSAPWSAPLADSPQAVGLKNGGLSEITSDIIYPASRLQDGDFQSGRSIEFRFRSDSSRHWLPRESRMLVEYEFAFGETASSGTGDAHNKLINIGAKAPKFNAKGQPPNANVAMTAAPNASLFDQARFVMNSVTLENQPNYYDTACAHMLTKTDRDSPDTTGSGMLNSLRKDHGRKLTERMQRSGINFEHARSLVATQNVVEGNEDGDFSIVPTGANAGATVRRLANTIVQQHAFARDNGLCNPKCEILQMGYDHVTGKVTVQISEPFFFSTWQHPYAIPACDMQMFFQISRTWLKDLLWCSDYSYGCFEGAGGIISPIPSSGNFAMGQAYCSIKKVEAHVAYISPLVASIPPSIGIKYSGLSLQTVLLSSLTVNEQIVVPPSCRAVYLCLRQRYHHICACREELGRAGSGYNEICTSLPAIDDGTDADDGQQDPRYQGRAVPHNLATLAQGTSDDWIRHREGGPNAAGSTNETTNNMKGLQAWTNGAPTVTKLDTGETLKANSFNKIPLDAETGAVGSMAIAGANGTVTIPTVSEMEKEATTHFTDLSVQLGSAHAPKIPFSNLDPTKGNVSRMWSGYLDSIGKPLGLRPSTQSLAEYCGWDNANGPSFPRNGNRGPIALLRILNPPNSLSNVLQIRGNLAPCKSYTGTDLNAPKSEAQLELVAIVVHDNLMSVNWAPPAELPLKTATAPIV